MEELSELPVHTGSWNALEKKYVSRSNMDLIYSSTANIIQRVSEIQ
jgi:hypothetical protein